MRIKEVEEKTNLSSKAIRFYEDKGLLTIARDASGYRNYSEENVQELLTIKLYRKCGLSIQDMIDIQKEKISLNDVLYQKISEISKKDLELSEQKNLCLEVIKAKGNYQELYETIKIRESEDFQGLLDELLDRTPPSLGKQVLFTIILSGPLLNSLMFLSMKQYDRLWWGIILTIIATICLTISWQSFLKAYKFYNETWSKGILHTLLLFGILVIGILVIIVFMIGLAMLQLKIFFHQDVFILSSRRLFIGCFLLIGLECFLILLSFLSRYLHHPNYQDYDFFIPFIQTHKWIVLFVNVLLCYCGMINVDVFTSSQIIHYSFFHPQGIVYEYQDIVSVKTGFYEHHLWMMHDKGDFYYQLTMNDGKMISVEDTQTTKEYEEDTYSELVVLDDMIMQYHPQKIADDRFSQYLMMDQVYIDRFLSIVHNDQ